jgi:hypothetical protein
VKLNAAAVLKDEFVIKKQAEELINQLAFLESGQGHISEFLRWQSSMKLNDLKNDQERIEMKKLMSKLSYEEAIAARQNVAEFKKMLAKQKQEETNKIMEEYLEKERIESIKRNNQVKETLEDEKKVKQIKEQVKAVKKQIAQEVIKESEKLQEQAYKEVRILSKRKN